MTSPSLLVNLILEERKDERCQWSMDECIQHDGLFASLMSDYIFFICILYYYTYMSDIQLTVS
jgi:hypothetical protein